MPIFCFLVLLSETSPPLRNRPKSDNRETHLLNVIVTQRPSILELLPCENQPLLVWRDPLFILDLGLDVINGIAGLDLEGDGLSRKGLDKAVSYKLVAQAIKERRRARSVAV